MLFIYGRLALGGIETFFVRMAKERAKKGLVTKILLFSKPEQSNKALLEEMKKYADVYFVSDLYPKFYSFSRRFPLIAPVNKKKFKEMMKGVTQLHAYDGMHLLLANRFNKLSNQNLPITVGFYHYIKYAWGKWDVAYYERVNRKFIFNYLPRKSIMFCTEGVKDFYKKQMNIDLNGANTFRIGVVDKKDITLYGNINKILKIVAIGRLVEFKTYNFFMLDVIKSLKEKGIEVIFDIYGDGPEKEKIMSKIKEYKLENYVTLKGLLEYELFDTTVKKYDIFVGSGTAIIQAAGLGVPSIVGIENMLEAKTYGYFSDVYEYEYNLKGLDLPLLDIEQMLLDYIAMSDEERLQLKTKHLNAIDIFTNEYCSQCMEELSKINMPKEAFKYNIIWYEITRVIDRLNMKFNKNHPRTTQFEDLKKS